MSKRKPEPTQVVPRLPQGYRDGALPALPLRNEIVSIASTDGVMVSGVQPPGVRVTMKSADLGRVDILDPATAELMLKETRYRDSWADRALVEIFSKIEGQEFTPELLHWVRMRLRQFADDVHCLARITAAHVNQRERVRKHCKVDPVAVYRLVTAKIASGTTATDAFIEVADETDAAPETIRNAYYKHRKTAGK